MVESAPLGRAGGARDDGIGRMLLKAELHCHIEGAASPELVVRQAARYGADVSPFSARAP